MINLKNKLKQNKIAAIISFCTHDYRFLKKCLYSIAPLVDQLIVVSCDHFFDGTAENYPLLEKIYRLYPQIEFLELVYNEEDLFGTAAPLVPQGLDWAFHWHNSFRYAAYFYLQEDIGFVLWLDADEIVDSERFMKWLSEANLAEVNALRFASYWYFRKSCYRATSWPDTPTMIRKEAIDPEYLLDEDERMGLYQRVSGKKRRHVLGKDGLPFFHHYSWVRTKKELLEKVSRWGHRHERDWKGLIENEYARSFAYKDFVRGYTYEKVASEFDPLKVAIPKLKLVALDEHLENIKRMDHVRRISSKEIFRKHVVKL